MKGNKKLLIVAVLLLLVAVSYTTYAIYKTSVAGNAKVTAAIWNVKFKNGETALTDNFTVTLGEEDCTSNHVAPGKIAPGATCTKTIILDTTGTEVDVTYEATAGTVTAEKPEGTAVATTNANAFTAALSPATGTIAYTSTGEKQLTLTVTWDGQDDSVVATGATPDVINNADTALNGAIIKVPVTLTAKQVVGA